MPTERPEALDAFGKLLMAKVRDTAILSIERLLEGTRKDEAGRQFSKMLAAASADNDLRRRLATEGIDAAIGSFLNQMSRPEFDLIYTPEGSNGIELKDVSDGLVGELYGPNGWVAKFSGYDGQGRTRAKTPKLKTATRKKAPVKKARTIGVWSTYTVPAGGGRKLVVHEKTLASETPAAMVSGLKDFWTRLFDEIRSDPDTMQDDRWDTVFCELWLDGGRIIGYPGVRSRAKRDESINVEMTIPSIESAWRELKVEPATYFDKALKQLTALVMKPLRETITDVKVAAARQALLKVKKFQVYAMEFDDAETLQRF